MRLSALCALAALACGCSVVLDPGGLVRRGDGSVMDATSDAGTDAALPDTGTGCATSRDCTEPTRPVCSAGACTACGTNSQCMTERALPLCAPSGACVECETATSCPSARPLCSPAGRCVDCLADSDCASVAPRCVTGVCTSCLETTGCTDVQQYDEYIGSVCRRLVTAEEGDLFGPSFLGFFCSGRLDLLNSQFATLRTQLMTGQTMIDDAVFVECVNAPDTSVLFECLDRALVGRTAMGNGCSVDYDCASRNCVDSNPADMTCTGTCGPPRTRAAGSPCQDSTQCNAGLFCTSAFRCAEPGTTGQACVEGNCAAGLYCDATSRCTDALTLVGNACTFGTRTVCGPLAFCPSNVCVRKPTALGDACDEFQAPCPDGLDCPDATKVCSARPVEGAACRPAFRFPRCAMGLRCAGTVCQTPSADGVACSNDNTCRFGSRCVRSVCTAIRVQNEPCMDSAVCAPGLGCIMNRCRPLPDVGSVCTDAGCLRGVCMAGACTALAPDAPCTQADSYGEFLDPCGANASCRMGMSTRTCVAEVGAGQPCDTGAMGPYCTSGTLRCSNNVCVANNDCR